MERAIVFGVDEQVLIVDMLEHGFEGRFFTVTEYEILNRIRQKLGMEPIAGIDDDFISAYGNCFKGCSG